MLRTVVIFLATVSVASAAETAYEKEVLPILQAHCLSCHGGEGKIKGGLRLTSREELLKGGDTGPAIDVSHPEKSLLIAAIGHGELKMPPKGKLPQAQIEILTSWVKAGAPFPANTKATVAHSGPPQVDAKARSFWAFKPVVRPSIPNVKDSAWVRNPIDAFVLAKLESKNSAPAPLASKTTLLRRVTYAVTGLPPTPEETAAFVSDMSPDAYEKVVDRLLASRHYGEHWARHWMDLVRYAETNSFERDDAKPFVWRYRDYLIRAFNEDKSYGRFVREQLAGDELPDGGDDGLIATGYYRLGIWDDEPADRLLAYYDGLDDIASVTGQTFLGLTVGCARCHDHKIDPFPQKDYYKFVSFFAGVRHYTPTNSVRTLRTANGNEAFRKQSAEYQAKVDAVENEILMFENAVGDKLTAGEKDDFQFPKSRPSILKRHVPGLISVENHQKYLAALEDRHKLRDKPPKSSESALCVSEEKAPKDIFVLLRGNPTSHGEKVEPGFPLVVTEANAKAPKAKPVGESSGRRTMLADWIVEPTNPLTARVMVNRLWQYDFGRGLVRSSSNFGYMGTPPTHPELLDWLAAEFTSNGMKMKAMHRLLLTSNTFRMASSVEPSTRTIDPENDLYTRFDLRRLSAEELRDSVLATAGNLNRLKKDGPSIYPPLPAEVLAGQSRPGSGWGKNSPEETASRSVFVHIKRSLGVPLLTVFDGPDPDAPCPVRFTTTQPTQALAMINGEFLNTQARVLAMSLTKETGDVREQVKRALMRVSQKNPLERDVERGVKFIAESKEKDGLSAEESLRRFCLLALSLNEFLYID